MKGPVVVIGMHRSGTSLVVRMLEQLGLFIGRVRDPNDEATFFLKTNEWLLRQSGGAWDHPQSIDTILQAPDAREGYAGLLREMVRSPRAMLYLGGWRYLRTRGEWSLREPWGWKDPRTTFTLPLWREVFSQPKIVHIVRHGLDVALSLQAREQQKLKRWNDTPNGWRRKMGRYPRRQDLVSSPRCLSLRGGFTLWDAYVARARDHVRSDSLPSLELRFEELIADPEEGVRALASFCDLHPDPARTGRCLSLVEPARGESYRGKRAAAIRALADQGLPPEMIAQRLSAHGYAP